MVIYVSFAVLIVNGIENYRLDREFENNLIVKVATVCMLQQLYLNALA